MKKVCIFIFAFALHVYVGADNQTPTVSAVFPDNELPFRIKIELADFMLPNGIHSGVWATHKGKWLLFGGRTNGLHGFNPGDHPTNFPPSAQNTNVYVVDSITGKVYSRSLANRHSGLTQDQIDSLSSTSPQFYQWGNTLYITGGYGFSESLNNYTTFEALTAVDVPGLIQWVIQKDKHKPATCFFRQIFDPVFKITGGVMDRLSKDGPTLLVFGQDFDGGYKAGDAFQQYSEQVRRFHILDDGCRLGVKVLPSLPLNPDPSFRRRDLNIVRVLSQASGKLTLGLSALSGVFTESVGAWTVPVNIGADGFAFMPNPGDPNTFKQAMNNYVCSAMGLYSRQTGDMYTVLFGGLTYGFFVDDTFETDSEFPFTNQVTTIRINRTGAYKQFYMKDQTYPVILSTQSNPGNQLLFGTSAYFIPAITTKEIKPEVIDFDRLKRSRVVGYIVGGIQSTLPNTTNASDSAASPYIFKVSVELVSSDSSSD